MPLKSILNFFSDAVLMKFPGPRALTYLHDRALGLQYGSYSISDEAALALSFMVGLPEGGVIIDAGANAGAFTSQVLSGYSPNVAQVIVVEPQAACFAVLEQLAATYSLVSPEQSALGSQSGSTELYFGSTGSTLASVYRRDVQHAGLSFTDSAIVNVTTVDHMAEKYDLKRIDYLKLDLEGHELEAIKGAQKIIDEHRVSASTFEFGGCNIDSRTHLKDFWNLLVEEHAFRLYRILPKRRLLALSHYSESLERFDWHNILACALGIKPSWTVVEYE